MNKRIFTLMAAAMLVGAPMSNLAFASSPLIAVAADATGDENARKYETASLANGLKFILKNSNNQYLKAVEVEDTDYYTKTNETTTDDGEATVFEIRNYSNKTFTLWVDGNQVVVKKDGSAYSASDEDDKVTVFLAKKSGNVVTDKTDFTKICTSVLGSDGENVFEGTAYTRVAPTTDETLNDNLAGNGFSFQFPDAKVSPEKNPFGNQMIAIEASKTCDAVIGSPSAGLYFVLANEAGKKLLSEVGADTPNNEKIKAAFNAATFVVVNPLANFGITGFDKNNAEGQDFTTVKGEKLASKNVKKDGKIAYTNAVYTVSEQDELNGAGEYTIKMKALIKDDDDNATGKEVYVGVYDLLGGGLKSYVTTKSESTNLSLAQTAGNNYVKAADLLKTSDVALYNIYFMGEKPAENASGTELNNNWSGKYLVNKYGTSFTSDAVAPADVDLKSALAQWYVTKVEAKGVVEFKNLETAKTISCKLYTTDKAGIYKAVISALSGKKGIEVVKLVPSKGIDAFLTLTDAQMKQGAELIFNGTGNVTVKEVYMKKGDGNKFVPTSDSDDSYTWKFEKSSSAKQEIEYAYLEKSEVKAKKVDTLAVQSYFLVSTKNGKKYGLQEVSSTDDEKSSDYKLVEVDGETELTPFVFKKYADGHYAMIAVEDGFEYVDNIQQAGIKGLYVDNSDVDAEFAAEKIGNDKEYSHITVSFLDLGESLEATPRHATLDSDEGAISFKADKNGILEGIIAADGLTFWLDTADSKADMPAFYISKGIATEETPETKAAEPAALRNFLYFAQDSAEFWNEDKAAYDEDKNYFLAGTEDVKAIFRPAALVGVDTIKTSVNNQTVLVSKEAEEDVCLAGVENFKFYITKAGNGYKVVPAAAQDKFLYNLNGKLGFTSAEDHALIVTVGAGDPTSNESIDNAASSIAVIAGNGTVTVQGAAGQNVKIVTVLGKVVADETVVSDNATIAAPAGIVFVTVGDETVKVAVK
ncbi:DUF6383 domain-containing protein [Parabacteroides sp.]